MRNLTQTELSRSFSALHLAKVKASTYKNLKMNAADRALNENKEYRKSASKPTTSTSTNMQ
jgi:hypothetical protein